MKDSAKAYESMPSKFITTVTGRQFHIDKPVFDINDIAPAIAKQCRFTGHTVRFYSVAEHCILVADLMDNLKLGDPFEGLMHDACEAYLSDIASPFKSLLPEYRALEQRIEVPLRAHWGLPSKTTGGCKVADWLALFIEAHALIPTRGEDFLDPENLRPQALDLIEDYPIRSHPWELAAHLYLTRYQQLGGEIS